MVNFQLNVREANNNGIKEELQKNTASQKAANNLQVGVLAGIGFPIVLVISVLYVRKKYR